MLSFKMYGKAYDTVWRDGLWVKLWDVGVKGRMWRVIKKYHIVRGGRSRLHLG